MRKFVNYVETKFPNITITPKVHFPKFQHISSKNTLLEHCLVRKKQHTESKRSSPTEVPTTTPNHEDGTSFANRKAPKRQQKPNRKYENFITNYKGN